MGFHEIGLDLDRPVEARDGRVVAPRLHQRKAVEAQRVDGVGIDPQGLAEKVLRLFELAGLEIDQAERHQGLEVPGGRAQEVVIGARSLGELAAAVQILRVQQRQFGERGVGHGANLAQNALIGQSLSCLALYRVGALAPSSPIMAARAVSRRHRAAPANPLSRPDGSNPVGFTTIFTSLSMWWRR